MDKLQSMSLLRQDSKGRVASLTSKRAFVKQRLDLVDIFAEVLYDFRRVHNGKHEHLPYYD